MAYQYFKDDDTERKIHSAAGSVLVVLGSQLTSFQEDAYNCQVLGDVIWNLKASPLASGIVQSVFRQTFNDLFTSFQFAGTFEAYISVLKKVFGDSATIQFTVPAPGKLNIAVVAAGVELSDFVARRIQDDAYLFENVVDQLDEQIVFQTIKGFQTQYELELMLFEMVPNGIYTQISLTIGG